MGYTHGIEWTEELIISEINKVINGLGIERFPTHSEMEMYFGNKSLVNQISKKGGTKFWANKLGYNVKQCESEFGNFYELYALNEIQKELGYNGHPHKPRYPYDLTINNHIKIDVKSSNITITNNNYKTYTFNLEKKDPTCDIYMFYCIDENENILGPYIVPSCILAGKTQVGISAIGETKYKQFFQRWDIIQYYNNFYLNTLRWKV